MARQPMGDVFITDAELATIRQLIGRDPEAALVADRSIGQPARKACGRDLLIPPSPLHGARRYFDPITGDDLIYDRLSPDEHRSASNKVYRGKDYDRGWVDITHTFNANDARTCALAGAIYDDAEAADLAKRLVMGYAAAYHRYPPSGRIRQSWGKVTASGLEEAVWALGMLWATELLFKIGRLTPAELTQCRKDLFEPIVDLLWGEWPTIHNIRLWINAAIGCIGLAFGDRAAIREAIQGPIGFRQQLAEGFALDGLSVEGSPGYHAYGAGAVLFLAEAMARNGYEPYRDRQIHAMIMAPLRLLQPNDTLPGVNDYPRHSMFPTRLYGTALRRLDDDELGAAANFAFSVWRRNNFGPDNRYGSQTRIWSTTPAYYARQQVDWLLAWERIGEQTHPRLAAVEKMSASGIGVVRPGRGDYVLLKCGCGLGYGHDHYDRLHINWWHDGVCWLDDAGSGDYSDPMHGGWFRLTLAHNTVLVDHTLHDRCDGKLLHCDQHQLAGSIKPYPNLMPDVLLQRSVKIDAGKLCDTYTVKSDRPRLVDYVLRPMGRLSLPPDTQAVSYGPLCAVPEDHRGHLVGLGYDIPKQVRRVQFGQRAQRALWWKQKGRTMCADLSSLPAQCEILIARAPMMPNRKDQYGDMLLLRQLGSDVSFNVTLEASGHADLKVHTISGESVTTAAV